MTQSFRFSLCNEVFEKWDFAESCKALRAAGYDGIEIAPFTLAEDPAQIPTQRRREYRTIIRSEGLQFVGLHWLMVSPKGLHVTAPDAALRERSWRHIHDLIDLCADLGENGVMVFGSPAQRKTTGGLSREHATKHYVDGLAAAAPHAIARGVTILIEALPIGQCDVVQTLAEAVQWVDQIGSPAVRTMFDTHNAVDEVEPHAVLVDRYFPYIRHVHLNELDGRHPGAADYDFKPLLDVLRKRHYQGWLSLEVFDFKPGAVKIATDSMRFLTSEIEKLGA